MLLNFVLIKENICFLIFGQFGVPMLLLQLFLHHLSVWCWSMFVRELEFILLEFMLALHIYCEDNFGQTCLCFRIIIPLRGSLWGILMRC